jgi:hypothetical protein
MITKVRNTIPETCETPLGYEDEVKIDNESK